MINLETKTLTRTQTKFLFLPKWIGSQVKWLTTATWEEEKTYQPTRSSLFNPFAIGDNWTEWKPTKFI